MELFSLLGAVLTLITVAFLGLGGYVAALRLLGRRAAEDPLELAVAALLAATAGAMAIGLALGAVGLLRIDLALALLVASTVALLRLPRPLSSEELAAPLGALWTAIGRQVRAHPALALLTANSLGAEAIRGLARPPLSWDSLMYHLLLAGTWLQEKSLAPVFGGYPTNYYGYAPGNGSVWLWWWMAPSHSELYANLAFLPHWAMLGLATGALARRLGARRSWPVAAFLATMTPVVLRFAATQYVDIFTAACLVAAVVFGLSWMRRPRFPEAALAGCGIGVAVGAKVIGIPYGGALAAALVVAAIGPSVGGWSAWRRRLPQLALALVLTAALGGYFYLRNVALHVDPLAMKCESAPRHEGPKPVVSLPRKNSVADLPGRMLAGGELLQAFLGITRPQSLELGVGPQSFLLLAAVLALPFALPRDRRREGWVAFSQIAAEVAFWCVVPYANSGHVFANTRYLMPAFGIGFAGALAIAESRGVQEIWLEAIGVALLAQDLLQQHAEMPWGVRVALGSADALAVLLALSPGLRRWTEHRAAALAAAALVLALALTPAWADFRHRDRQRALGEEYTAHITPGRLFAGGWGWLEENGGNGTVAVMMAPETYFMYPAMGQYLERRAIYVNVNPSDLRQAASYPLCQPRVDADPQAWIANLAKAGVKWLYVCRYPSFPFPLEDDWAQAHPDLFVLRHADNTNRIYEVFPSATSRP